jgi:prepilin-type N-terminal cleavage/methylation domain-containing protein
MADLPERRAGGCVRRVAFYTPRQTRGDAAAGFSLIELLIVLAVFAIISTVYMALHRPSEVYPVENAVQRLAGEIERVRDQAVATEGEALIAVLPDGRYAARAGAAGTLMLGTTPADEWENLPEGLAWGAGDATDNPFAGAVGPLPAQVFCDADGLCNAPLPGAVYLVRSIREGHRVAAVTLDAGGTIHTWRWRKGDRKWLPIAR